MSSADGIRAEPTTRTRVLVGFDASPGGRDALALAGFLVDRLDGDIVVTCVDPETERSSDPARRAETAAEALREAAAYLSFLPKRVAVIERSAAAIDPADAIAEIAAEEEARICVIGSTHRAGIGRIGPGPVSDRLLHRAPAALAIAPRGLAQRESPTGACTVTLLFDGGEESRRAAAFAAGLARDTGATLRALLLLPEVEIFSEAESLDRAIDHDVIPAPAELELEWHGLIAELAPDLEVDSLEVRGDVISVLPPVEGGDLDLLLVGARHHGALATFSRDPVLELARDAPRPLIVVPPDAAPSPERP